MGESEESVHAMKRCLH